MSFWSRLANVIRGDGVSREIDEELQSHIDEAVREGRDPVEARRAFGWFLGQNDLDASVYNPDSGGCRDGLHVDRVNLNEGAESTLAFLTARVFFSRRAISEERLLAWYSLFL